MQWSVTNTVKISDPNLCNKVLIKLRNYRSVLEYNRCVLFTIKKWNLYKCVFQQDPINKFVEDHKSVTRVQILDQAVCISLHANAFGGRANAIDQQV